MILNGSDLACGGPVNSADDFVLVVSLGVSDHGHGGKESFSEFFIGVDGELIDSHFVGLGVISVVLVDGEEVLFEDESSVGLFFGSEGDTESGLEFFEGVELSVGGGVVGTEDGEGYQSGNQELFSHLKLLYG